MRENVSRETWSVYKTVHNKEKNNIKAKEEVKQRTAVASGDNRQLLSRIIQNCVFSHGKLHWERDPELAAWTTVSWTVAVNRSSVHARVDQQSSFLTIQVPQHFKLKWRLSESRWIREREPCEEERWRKWRGKQPQWDEGRCLCFTLLHKTITTRAHSPSIYLSIWEKKRSGGGRKREREGEVLQRERVKLVVVTKKKVLTHTGQSRARSLTKKDDKDGKVFTLSKALAALM